MLTTECSELHVVVDYGNLCSSRPLVRTWARTPGLDYKRQGEHWSGPAREQTRLETSGSDPRNRVAVKDYFLVNLEQYQEVCGQDIYRNRQKRHRRLLFSLSLNVHYSILATLQAANWHTNRHASNDCLSISSLEVGTILQDSKKLPTDSDLAKKLLIWHRRNRQKFYLGLIGSEQSVRLQSESISIRVCVANKRKNVRIHAATWNFSLASMTWLCLVKWDQQVVTVKNAKFPKITCLTQATLMVNFGHSRVFIGAYMLR